MKRTSLVAKLVLEECGEDYVGLWSIVREMRGAGSASDTLLPRTLTMLEQLLREGKIVAGDFQNTNFRQWGGSPQQIIARIEKEWTDLGRDPDIGEIVWFTCPKP